MKCAFIKQHRRLWPVSVQCRILQVSAAAYQAHLVRRASDAQRRRLSDEALLVHIKALHAETRSAYDWPRIWRELVARGIAVGKDRVQKLMQLHGIRVKGKRRFKVTTLLIPAGDNPSRLHSEAALAALCGTSPLQASSGKIQRHRLNRGGDRQANNRCGLLQWFACEVTPVPGNMSHDGQAKDCLQRRFTAA